VEIGGYDALGGLGPLGLNTIGGVMSLKLKLFGMVAAILTSFAVSLLVTQHSIDDLQDGIIDNLKAVDAFTKTDVVMLGHLRAVRLEVVQVQQFFQDIAATRGLDGLDDGLENAAQHADMFRARLGLAKELAKQSGMAEMSRLLDQIGVDFEPYFVTGRQMAEAYVAKGPAGGNPMMPAFDEVATRIQDSATRGVEMITAQVDKSAQDLSASSLANVDGAQRAMWFVMGLGLVCIMAGAVVGIVITGSVVRPLGQMTGVMESLAADNLDVVVPSTDRTDEIGLMAKAVQHFKEQLIQGRTLEAQARADQERELARGRTRELLTADFDVMIRRVIAKVDNTVQSVHSTSTSLHSAAAQTSQQSQAVAAAAEQASANIQTVATAAEELGASTQEISRRVQDSTRITLEAVDGVRAADRTIEGLSEASGKIGEIVSLINDIASRTNLLALNATIEAARAGEAGKGFAVVAGEVKSLANQTALATAEIDKQIGGIQGTTRDAVEAIKAVGQAISQVDEVVSSIAAAVEEQNAATQEIVRNVQEAADGNQHVTQNISDVSKAATETGAMAVSMNKVADVLAEAGGSLGKHVETFLGSVKAV
jgi:methyl-accepting chemotaxis protein